MLVLMDKTDSLEKLEHLVHLVSRVPSETLGFQEKMVLLLQLEILAPLEFEELLARKEKTVFKEKQE